MISFRGPGRFAKWDLVRDNLTDGSSADGQLMFMQHKCSQAAELLGLHEKARQVQPREYIVGNERLTSVGLTARKQQRLLQIEQLEVL